MTTQEQTTTNKMQGGVRRRGDRFEYTVDLGRQPAQRCPACKAAKRKPTRWWLGRRALPACPACGGDLVDTLERREQTQGGFLTEKAAKKARTDALHDLNQGTHVRRDKITVREWFENEWTPTKSDGDPLARSTQAGYRAHVKNHIAGTKLGAIPLQELSREDLKRHFAWLRAEGRCDGEDKPLSARTQRSILATISKGLSDAVESHLLPLNPAARLPLPKAAKPRRPVWSSEQVSRFLTSVKDDELAPLWLLIATTGMRRGEALCLRWTNIDLDAATVTIQSAVSEVERVVDEGDTKNVDSVRTLDLPPATVAGLRRHRTDQKSRCLARGVHWQASELVFSDEAGEWLRPGTVSTAFIAAVRRSELPTLSLHGLRHSWATIAIVEHGVDIVTVSKQLGHANVSTTLDIYSHALNHQAKQAVHAVAGGMVPADF